MALAKGTEPLAVGLDSTLMAEFRTFAERRGEKIRAVVEAALRRHMANPPSQELPPLPPVAAPPEPAPAKKPAGRARKKT